jgi:hypothetical protein
VQAGYGMLDEELMSEFKFACPVCGQHITADSSTSGGRIDCPTCFRKIVVPQAPSCADPKLIISASQADKPRPPQGAVAAPEWDRPRRRGFPVAVLLLVLLLGALVSAFVFREKLSRWTGRSAEPPTNAPGRQEAKAPRKVYEVPTNLMWTLDSSKTVLPESVAAGRIHGSGFKCERAVLQGGTLNLRQGKSGPADLGMSIHLFAQQGEELSGKLVEISADRSPPLPRVVLRWKDEQDKVVTQNVNRGYTLKLAFGEAADGRIPGKIYIGLPDDTKSFVAGAFNAEIRKPAPPKVKQSKPKTSG